MNHILKYAGVMLILLSSFRGSAQEAIGLVQLSGVTVMSEEGDILPFVRILNKTGNSQTTSSIQGVYTMVAKPGDTIQYQFIGFETASYIVPRQPGSRFITHTQRMAIDTFYLPEALVKPLPSKQRLEYEFVYKDITDDQLAMAGKNTEMSQLLFIANVLMKDGLENSQLGQEEYINRLIYKNQQAPQNILSPQAWADFMSQLFKPKK